MIGPDQARDSARARIAQLVLKGEDPVQARILNRQDAVSAKANTFEKVARRYIDGLEKRREKQNDKGRELLDGWVLEAYVFPKFGRLHVAKVTTQMVKDLILDTQAAIAQRNIGHTQERAGKVTANRVHGVIRRFYTWAVDGEVVDRNPAAFKRLFQTKPTKRIGVVTEERLRKLWIELDDKAQAKRQTTPLAIHLYILTLQRPIDVARARREHFDFAAREWRIPWTLTKTGEPYIIPLTGLVMDLVVEAFGRTESEYLFPGADYGENAHVGSASMGVRFKRAVADLTSRQEWPAGRRMELYDFRRFGRTQLVHRLGFSKDVAERVINHAEGGGIDQLYDVHDYQDELRRAHEAWAEYVSQVISREGASR